LGALCACVPVMPVAGQAAARQAGLGPNTPCLVVVAVPRAPVADEQVLHSASGTMARACGSRLMPLTVLRRDEIVVVAGVRNAQASQVVAGLTESYERLAQQQLRPSIGVGAVQSGLTRVAAAHP